MAAKQENTPVLQVDENSGLAYQRLGHGIPIVIVHGWMMTGVAEAYDFEPVFQTTEGYERIYVDLPGMGASPANGITDLDFIFDRLDEFIAQIILPKPFLLIGSSCGAYLTRALAFRYAPEVTGLLLRVPLVVADNSKRDIDQYEPLISDDALIQSLSAEDKDDFGYIPIQTPDYLATLQAKTNQTFKPAVAVADSKALNPIRNDPTRYVLHQPMHSSARPFKAPTLIVQGRHDPVVGYRDGSTKEFLESYPRATTIIMDGATHGLPVTGDEKLLFKALVLDWLGRVDQNQRTCI